MMRVADAGLAPRAGDDWTRWLVVASLLVGAISLIVVLDYGGYPYEPYRYWIFEYLLRTQDLSGSALLMLLVLVAYFSPARPAVLGWVDAISRHPWRAAAVAFVVLCLGTLYVEHNYPLAQDEYAALFQSRAFASGHLTGQFPPELVGRLIPPFNVNRFLYGSFQTGNVASAYWPGFALVLAPFSLINVSWACNPLLASLALVLMSRLAVRLSGEPQAGGWAILLALGSPGFTGMAITYFSMTAHLLLNLAFAWLLFERTFFRLVLAGLVGSFALLLHNPMPHFLFALPWIVWLALQPDRLRKLLALAAGYAPLALGVGFGWALLLSQIQGNALSGLFPFDDNPYHKVANFFWDWHVKMRSALPGPGDMVLSTRIAELVRLWNWAVPGLPVLAAAGWWMGRRDPRTRLLGLSFACTFLGYMGIGFTQGHGWGARYVHPAWGTLPVLGATALVLAQDKESRLKGYVASLTLLSMVFATLLRSTQIYGYLDMHLANRPAATPGARQIVFVTFDRPNYTADLVQNDPLLRDDVWYMFSYGRARDRSFIALRFPGARLISEDRRGEIWLLDPAAHRPLRPDHRPP
ncbi:MAG TPA: hypothetical protein VE008_11990 [Burkholderiales bacterium]|nr:hypothetical protein [Burkholderiales bacterium]